VSPALGRSSFTRKDTLSTPRVALTTSPYLVSITPQRNSSGHRTVRRSIRRDARNKVAIAKGIVDAHRGRIWAESAEGAGSTFSFTLPIAGPVDA